MEIGMKTGFWAAVFSIAMALPSAASHVIANAAKSGQRVLVTDMFWTGNDCAGIDLSFELVAPPANGTVSQRKTTERLNSAKIRLSPANRCDGRVMPISYVYYQSNRGFRGTDRFTVRWTNRDGATREKTYTVFVE